ncbi:protein lplB [Paenibacillus sp. Soil766]|nr:protein lplB [Paenibacillus sp. Soil766]
MANMKTVSVGQVQVEKHGLIVKQSRFKKMLIRNAPLLLMFAPVIVYFVIFKYIPMVGTIIAFKDYNYKDGIFGSPWVGFDNFKALFQMPDTVRVIMNSFRISILKLIVEFPLPILLAILLNEVRKSWYKKTVQTLVYLPHFLSWVIVGGVVVVLFSQETGIINKIIAYFGLPKTAFLYQTGSWFAIFLGAGVWKEAGYQAIVYLAALSAIDPSLYEAASIDGAGKWRKIWNITLPSLTPTIMIMFILTIGRILEVGFDQVYILQNPVVTDVSQIISTYIYKFGLQGGQINLTSAMGLFESFISLVLIVLANGIARKFGNGLW